MKPMMDMTVPEILDEIRERSGRPSVSRQHWTVLRLMAEALAPLFAACELGNQPHAAQCSMKEAEAASYKADSMRGLHP